MVHVRRARTDEAEAVIALLDAALLAFDREAVRRRVPGDRVLVAEIDERIVGAALVDGTALEAIAVRPRYRRAGVGRRLVEEALARHGRITATCDPRHRAFYESLGFVTEDDGNGRVRAERLHERGE